MSLVRLLALRSFRTRPFRILLTLFGIILGVAAFSAIQLTNRTSLESISQLFEDTSGRSDLVVTVSEGSRKNLIYTELQRIVSTPGVEHAAPIVKLNTDLAVKNENREIEFGFLGLNTSGLLLYGIDPVVDPEIREYQIIAGDFLSPELNAFDIVLVESYAKENNIELGEKISIITNSGLQTLKVIGIISRDGPGQINNGGFGIIPIETAQYLSNRPIEFDQIDITLVPKSGDIETVESIKNDLQKRLGPQFSILFPTSKGESVNQMLFGYQIGLNFLSGMALFVGMFLIYNSFSMTVIERTREIGYLRTVGMTRSQITRLVLLEAVLLALAGSSIGIVFGYVLAQGLSQILGTMLTTEPGQLHFTTDILAVSFLIGIVVTLFSALVPAWRAGRISPLQALRVRGIQRDGWFLRFSWMFGILLLVVSSYILILNPFPTDVQFRLGIITVSTLFLGATLTIPIAVGVWELIMRPFLTLLYGSSGTLGGRNIQRSKLRTTLTVAALMVGVSMILITRGMTDSFRYDLENWIDAFIGGDLTISSSVTMKNLIWRQINAVEGVETVAPVRYFSALWKKPDNTNENLTFMSVDLSSYLGVTSFVFSDSQQDINKALDRFARGDAIFVSSAISEKFGIKKGDVVTLRTRKGLHDFEVAAIVVDFFNQGQVIHGNWNDMRRYFNIDDASLILVKVKPDSTIQSVQTRIEDSLSIRHNLTVASNQVLISRALRMLRQSYSLFDVLVFIALIVAAMGVVNTLTMNVIERTQEIGMLRSIGQTRTQVLAMILAEAGLMGLIGGILGLILGFLLTRIFLAAMTAMSGYKVTFIMPLTAILAGVFISLLVSQLAAIFPAHRAASTRILDAIHYE